MFKIAKNVEQGSEEWLNLRKGRATASEAKRVITPTGKKSTSSEGYMRQLARECVLDDPMIFMGNKHTEWGNEHEAEAREWFINETGLGVSEVGFCTREDGVIGFSPDGLGLNGDIAEDGSYTPSDADFGLEIKCPSVDKHVEYLMAGGLPAEHKNQIHWSMAASGILTWYYVSYFPGLSPLIVAVHADEHTQLVKAAQDQFIIDYAPVREAVLNAILPNRKTEQESII